MSDDAKPANRFNHLIRLGAPPGNKNNPNIAEDGRATQWNPPYSVKRYNGVVHP